MTDYTELKRLAEACIAAGEYLPGEAWEEDRSYCQAEVAFLEFVPVATPAAVQALIAENERLNTLRSATERDLAQELEVWRSGPSCWSCGDTGDVHDMVGEWRGQCDCNAAKLIDVSSERKQLKAENEALNTAIEDLERGRVAGFEEYDFTRLKDRRGDQKVFEITIETECGCDVEEGEYTVRITHLLGNWLGSDDFGLIADAVAEVVADLGLPEEGYTTFIAYESGERQDVYWTKWFEIATVASVLAEPGAAMGKGEQS
ncbi:hypothetical protein HX824_05815 [Pseudomonas sp. D4002]|uniref:hypothetical protein n=1 Tax=Pseudomonas sp. D4002 TaxID=2738817 RepID=UPI0015A4BBFB|nr:hypothetical protein [Pseudomonas sp. D4002]NWB20106.1 hypothetical protein [Pseudomonas sp. D4002]